jgi:Bacterial TSP3 repeat
MKYFTQQFLLALAILTALPVYSDDHGNSSTNATWIAPGSTGLVAQFETDIDRDWFRFTAAPLIVYTIQVNNITLWDNVFSIKAFAQGSDLIVTNSAFSNSPGRIIWTNTGGVRSYYLGVSALFEFTTGTYSVVISTNDYDLDGDGMADNWEILQFNTLTNGAAADDDGDGFSNMDEYQTGTAPTNYFSQLAVTNLWRQSGNSAIAWPGAAFGTYRVEATTNLRQAVDWVFINRVYRSGIPGPEQFIDTGNSNNFLHYRVIYEP